MKHTTIYIRPTCPYCQEALFLLEDKGVPLTIINISKHPEKREEMIQKSKRTTVPQIFIEDTHIGGCDDLMALEEKGELDKLLKKQ